MDLFLYALFSQVYSFAALCETGLSCAKPNLGRICICLGVCLRPVPGRVLRLEVDQRTLLPFGGF